MPTIAIGDIHGNLAALSDLLEQLAVRIDAQDTVVFLGDYIDRGPDARGCIARILDFKSSFRGKVVTLAGNHEDWLLRTFRDPTRHSWILGMDAFPTIASYSSAVAERLRSAIEALGPTVVTECHELPYGEFVDELPEEHLAFLAELKPYYRVENTVFVHGGVALNALPVEQQAKETLLWGADGFPEEYEGPDLVVYGHRDNAVLDADGWPMPRFSDCAMGLDTISHGVLSAVELPSGEIVQSARHDV
ncbi:metallophosphoesterase [bacterium]|nr:metallophosphoesterase [bacterium]